MSSRFAIVTGAARRIGAAIATHLARNGWDVCIHCHASMQEAQILSATLTQQFGVRTCVVQADLSCPEDLRRLISESAAQMHQAPSLLVNSAAVFEFDTALSVTEASWATAMDVNLRAPMLLSRYFAELKPEGGCVINLLDQKVFNLNVDYFSYTVSKLALEGATHFLARCLAPLGIRVCAVAPGITLPSGDQSRENFESSHTHTPLGRSSTPEDVASAVVFLASSPAITDEIIIVDGGQHLLPLPRDVMFMDHKG